MNILDILRDFGHVVTIIDDAELRMAEAKARDAQVTVLAMRWCLVGMHATLTLKSGPYPEGRFVAHACAPYGCCDNFGEDTSDALYGAVSGLATIRAEMLGEASS